jgi:hypothetical protein
LLFRSYGPSSGSSIRNLRPTARARMRDQPGMRFRLIRHLRATCVVYGAAYDFEALRGVSVATATVA